MNCYATVEQLKAVLGEGEDAELLGVLAGASREAEGPYGTGREFFTWSGARVVDGLPGYSGGHVLEVPDLLALTKIEEDTNLTGVWSWGEEIAVGDVEAQPADAWPKTQLRRLGTWGGLRTCGWWIPGHGRYRITGTWGYGDGQGASPWRATGVTVSVADGVSQTVTLSAATGIEAGQTILAGTEQLFVRSVTAGQTVTATVSRGVNRSTAAAHTTAPASVALYPEDLTRGVLWLAAANYRAARSAGVSAVQIGDYRETRVVEGVNPRVLERVFGRLRRGG